jgi:hypothetical protein
MRCECTIISCVVCTALPYFFILFHNGAIFRKTSLNIYFFLFSPHLLSKTFLILRRIKRDMITNVYRYSCQVPLFLSGFNKNFNLFDRFSERSQISNFMKIRLVVAVFVPYGPIDGRTDGQI